MSVENVNNKSNAGLCALGGAVIGGGGGAAAAYLTKPFLKNGAPTDEFIKKMEDNLYETLPEAEKEFVKEAKQQAQKMIDSYKNAKSVEEIKQVYMNTINKMIDNSGEGLLDIVKSGAPAEYLENIGIKVNPATLEELSKVNTIEEYKEFVAKNFDKEYAGKSLEEIKAMFEEESLKVQRKIGKGTFEQFWDSGSKKFVNCEEGPGAAIKRAAKSIQNKYALIYGGIGAAALALLGLLLGSGKKKEAPADKVDIKA